MPAPSLLEKEFFAAALALSCRVDGRSVNDLRDVRLSFGPELGWVECFLGKTGVVAVVDAKMVKPAADRPYEGMLNIHSEISPMASSDYDQGRPSENEVTIVRMLDKVLRRSDALDKESLCIVAGKRVWSLRLTLQFLADAGNMLDCACLAAIVALRHFRKPEVEVTGDDVVVHPPTSRAPTPLALHHTPICLSFALYSFTDSGTAVTDDSTATKSEPKTYALVDPDLLEATLSHGMLSVALNVQMELCVIQKAGGVALEQAEVLRLIEIAGILVKNIDSQIEQRLKEDWQERKIEIR